MLRVTVNNTVFTSAFINRQGNPHRIFRALELGRFEMVTSEALLSELARTLSKPRITRKYPLTADERAAFVALLRDLGHLATPPGTLTLRRDPDDAIVVETAVYGAADALVTGDKDLLECQEVRE